MNKSDLLIIVLCVISNLIGILIGSNMAYRSINKQLKSHFEKNDLRRQKRESLQP